jgi:hypothetical protein
MPYARSRPSTAGDAEGTTSLEAHQAAPGAPALHGVLYFDVQHNSESLGHGVRAMLWLTVTPSTLDAVGRALAEQTVRRVKQLTYEPSR